MKCQNCGIDLQDGAKFCYNCGAKVHVQPAMRPMNPMPLTSGQNVNTVGGTKAPKKGSNAWIVILVVATILIGGFFLMISLAITSSMFKEMAAESEETKEVTAQENNNTQVRPKKKGWNINTNQEVTVGTVKFSVPDYWEETKDDGSEMDYCAYAENDDEFAVFAISSTDIVNGTVSYEVVEDKTNSGELQEYFSSWLNTPNDFTVEKFGIGETKGFLYKTEYLYEGVIGCELIIGCIPVVADNSLILTFLAQTDGTEYDYRDDFRSMLESVKIVKENEKTATDKNEGRRSQIQNNSGVNPELKVFLDGYEEFVDEYITFMKKYQSGNYSLTMLNDYLQLLEKYEQYMNAINGYDVEDMSEADLKYYLEVTNRCAQKMLEIY